jgi:hypothetical protein
MSSAAVPPAQVSRLRSITKRAFSASTLGKDSRKLSRLSQWVVARNPSSSPARARVKLPVSMAPRSAPALFSFSSQLLMRRS